MAPYMINPHRGLPLLLLYRTIQRASASNGVYGVPKRRVLLHPACSRYFYQLRINVLTNHRNAIHRVVLLVLSVRSRLLSKGGECVAAAVVVLASVVFVIVIFKLVLFCVWVASALRNRDNSVISKHKPIHTHRHPWRSWFYTHTGPSLLFLPAFVFFYWL